MKTTSKTKPAFTLIELLITMTIIAILAVLIWVLLDPMEQMRKARDDARLSNAKELAKAIGRYSVSLNTYPWNKRTPAFTAAVRSMEQAYYYDPTVADANMGWMWTLVDAEEIKEAAAKRMVESGEYYVYKPAGNSGTYTWVCFVPESKMFKTQAAEACDARSRTAPSRYRTFNPCQTNDGTVPDEASGMYNLLCTAD